MSVKMMTTPDLFIHVYNDFRKQPELFTHINVYITILANKVNMVKL